MINLVNRKMERKDLEIAVTNLLSKLKIGNAEKFELLKELTGREIKRHDEVTIEEFQQLLIQLSLNLYKATVPNN